MKRQVWVYPSDGGEPYEKGTQQEVHGVVFIPDQPDFVSPIDGKVYSGRAGMRDHNARHNVVNNRDLVGLPTLTAQSDQRTTEQKRASDANRKQTIINQVSQYYR